ncbi:MAG: CDP-glucose 4,6-dehydratase [Candidatus Didemnitutus sp.]|nr:CDP-glucose 4,6-dehydratase [Candidatus Didemnitutus sp.]
MTVTNNSISRTFGGIYRGKRVLVTGHTGFKGSWLCEWLLALGADVTGLALPPATTPALFDELGLSSRMKDRRGDIRDLATVRAAVDAAKPDFIFHLAAQPLVRLSYSQPVETYATNIMGTVHLLEAVRLAGIRCAVVVVTTDKCYENTERTHAYREDEPMGGHDPYSSSKGAAELVVSAYRRSYFSAADSLVRLASARAGNVIGGGDWALDRIVPDCIRSLQRGEVIPVRNRHATRPWQHVLEPLSGYLWLGAQLAASAPCGELASAYNFGPTTDATRPVAALVEEVLRHWPGKWEDRTDSKAMHEATLLSLSIEKAARVLGWKPVWDFAATITHTVEWYRFVSADATVAADHTRRQIATYEAAARALNLTWAR